MVNAPDCDSGISSSNLAYTPLPHSVIGNTTDFDSVIIGSNPVGVAKYLIETYMISTCYCFDCVINKEHPIHSDYFNEYGLQTRMIVCIRCGNKRCPHGTNHSYECTNSNDPNLS